MKIRLSNVRRKEGISAIEFLKFFTFCFRFSFVSIIRNVKSILNSVFFIRLPHYFHCVELHISPLLGKLRSDNEHWTDLQNRRACLVQCKILFFILLWVCVFVDSVDGKTVRFVWLVASVCVCVRLWMLPIPCNVTSNSRKIRYCLCNFYFFILTDENRKRTNERKQETKWIKYITL